MVCGPRNTANLYTHRLRNILGSRITIESGRGFRSKRHGKFEWPEPRVLKQISSPLHRRLRAPFNQGLRLEVSPAAIFDGVVRFLPLFEFSSLRRHTRDLVPVHVVRAGAAPCQTSDLDFRGTLGRASAREGQYCEVNAPPDHSCWLLVIPSATPGASFREFSMPSDSRSKRPLLSRHCLRRSMGTR